MTPELVGLIGLVLLLLIIASGMPVAFSFVVVGLSGLLFLIGLSPTLHIMGALPYAQGSFYIYAALPLFILMGSFAFYGGITRDVYTVLNNWIGGLRGGLAMASVGACGGFAAVSGSSLATAAAIGKVTYGEMIRYNYHPRLAAGSIAAGGTIGSLIPPSTFFIIYGVIAQQSIAKLFMAGVFPGLLEVVFYCTIIYIIAVMKPSLAPRGPTASWKKKFSSLPSLIPLLVLVVVVLGGIYGGVFTPTEAAAVGAFFAFLIMVARKRLSRQNLFLAFWDTISVTGMIFFLIIGAMIFNVFVAASGLPTTVSEWLTGLGLPSYATLALILLLYIPLGMFMDVVGMVLLTLPIFLPTFEASGFSLIWIGVLMVRMMEIGAITPPLGLNCFVVADIAKLPSTEVFRGIAPFFVMDILLVAILVAFPQISLVLPSVMLDK